MTVINEIFFSVIFVKYYSILNNNNVSKHLKLLEVVFIYNIDLFQENVSEEASEPGK